MSHDEQPDPLSDCMEAYDKLKAENARLKKQMVALRDEMQRESKQINKNYVSRVQNEAVVESWKRGNTRLKNEVGRLREALNRFLHVVGDIRIVRRHQESIKVGILNQLDDAYVKAGKVYVDTNTPNYLNAAKADILEAAKKEFIASCSKQEDMMVLVRRWESRIEEFRREGKS